MSKEKLDQLGAMLIEMSKLKEQVVKKKNRHMILEGLSCRKVKIKRKSYKCLEGEKHLLSHKGKN